MIRLAVTGRNGQVARALLEAAGKTVAVVPVGRPELDLMVEETILPALSAVAPDVIVNAAAYTAVDLAEKEPELAAAVNAAGAGAVARAAETLEVPLIHLSTDYVFDGRKATAYTEEDRVAPLSIYGATKLGGEAAVAEAMADYAIVRTSWLYAPWGKNFVRTMVDLVGKKEEVRVVADQRGYPTYAPDLATALLAVAVALVGSPVERRFRGLFHYSGSGPFTSWAGFAEEIFTRRGGKTPRVVRVESADYPALAVRPKNSALNCRKFVRTFGVALRDWPDSLARCLFRLK